MSKRKLKMDPDELFIKKLGDLIAERQDTERGYQLIMEFIASSALAFPGIRPELRTMLLWTLDELGQQDLNDSN